MPSLLAQVWIIEILVVVTLLTCGLLLRRVFGHSGPQWLVFGLPTIALLSGIAWKFWPPLVDTRLSAPPGGQGAGIALLVLFLMTPLLSTRFRHSLQTLNWQPLAGFSFWRAVYGTCLIVLGLQAALPSGFFWSAGVGDIAAGLWGMWLAKRGKQQHHLEFKLWNAFALADLLHVLVLGAIYLRPFFMANPDVTPITLLPLAGVPILIAFHVFAAITIWDKRAP